MAQHFARTVPFDDLVNGLYKEVERGNVRTQAGVGGLVMFSYSEQCVHDRAWNQFSLISRGLVLDLIHRCVVATPFPKFFNYGEGQRPNEPMEPLPDEPFTATEKIDGSLIIVFFHNGAWECCTRGSFNSDQAQWAQRWLDQHPGWTAEFTPGHTYLFEVIYVANRIVVSYPYEGLVLLGAYDDEGYEYYRETLVGISLSRHEYRVADLVMGESLADLLTIAESLSAGDEGFVVRFQSGRRIKIKGAEYCRVHRLVSRVTPLAVWEMLLHGDDLRAVEAQLPEEFQTDLKNIERLLQGHLRALQFDVQLDCHLTTELSDKELGQSNNPNVKWIFAARKKNLWQQLEQPGSLLRQRFYEQFRPTGNNLPGYQPTSAVNRFGAS